MTQDEILLEVYSELVTIRRLLTTITVIAIVSAIFAVLFVIDVAG